METTINERARDAAAAVRNAAAAVCGSAVCEDTLENLADRTTRTMRHGLHVVDERRLEAAHCIKRHPFTAVGFTLAVGVAIGALIGGLEVKRRRNALLRED